LRAANTSFFPSEILAVSSSSFSEVLPGGGSPTTRQKNFSFLPLFLLEQEDRRVRFLFSTGRRVGAFPFFPPFSSEGRVVSSSILLNGLLNQRIGPPPPPLVFCFLFSPVVHRSCYTRIRCQPNAGLFFFLFLSTVAISRPLAFPFFPPRAVVLPAFRTRNGCVRLFFFLSNAASCLFRLILAQPTSSRTLSPPLLLNKAVFPPDPLFFRC